MENKGKWAWFEGDPGDICENAIVRDACQRGTTVKVLEDKGNLAIIEYRGESGAVPTKGLLERAPSPYDWGDKVVIVSKGTCAIIDLICWHFNEEAYYFYLKTNDGRPLKKRYFADELERA